MNKLYFKLAWNNIKNSKQFFLPYILTGVLIAALFYNMVTIQNNKGLKSVPGGANLVTILALGVVVISIFITIFLFYTNSFIIKRRKKELGMYNILGMEKRHIAKILIVETMFTAFISIGGGILIGILFNKFLMMLLYSLIRFDSSIQFYISGNAIKMTVGLFAIVYIVTLCYNLLQVRLSKPVELLNSGNVGEKEPRTKLLMAVTGVVCIAVGYYIAITTENPVEAVYLFFVAVLLVIIGTYCLFTAGSIAILKILRKNKNYYYQAKHFTSVSGMIYRMKQNAVGLANICILSTAVLIMMSATSSMFLDVEGELNSRYPYEISITTYLDTATPQDELLDAVKDEIAAQGRTITEEKKCIELSSLMIQNENEFFSNKDVYSDLSNSAIVTMIPLEEYQRDFGLEFHEELEENEVILVGSDYDYKEMKVFGQEFFIKEHRGFPDTIQTYNYMTINSCYYMLVKDLSVIQTAYESLSEKEKKFQPLDYQISLDIDGNEEEKISCEQDLTDAVYGYISAINDSNQVIGISVECRQMNSDEFYTMYGGLFFLGLFLGSLFLIVCVLIIFYKQISEGYEDKERFAIMEKVGMSHKEVKASIRSQVRMVFFLPLAMAAIHIAAAFPMIRRILALMNLTNVPLFVMCMIGSFVGFSVIYLIVFLLTSRSYYNIVGKQVS